MRVRSIVMFTLILSIIVVTLGLYVADQAQYVNPIHVVNGVTLVTTDQGDQEFKDVEYIHGAEVSIKPSAINTIDNVPVTLPSTAIPHGVNTCAMIDSHDNSYTVTTDQACDALK